MLDYNINELPPSHAYSDVLNIIQKGQVAYCYAGRKKGTFLLRDKNDSILMISEYNKENDSNYSYELWAFIHEIPNSILRQDAVNKLYELVNNYYSYLDLSDYKMRIE